MKKPLNNLNNILEDKSKKLFKRNKNYKVVSISTTSNVNNPELYFASYRDPHYKNGNEFFEKDFLSIFLNYDKCSVVRSHALFSSEYLREIYYK